MLRTRFPGLLIIAFLLAPISLWAQSTIIDCTFPTSWEGRQVLLVARPLGQPNLIDTTSIYNQRARFVHNIAEPCPAYIWVEGHKNDLTFFIDSTHIQLSVDSGAVVSYQVRGSTTNYLWKQFDDVLDSVRASYKREIVFREDTIPSSPSQQQIDSLDNAYATQVDRLIQSNPFTRASWYLFASNYTMLPHPTAVKLLDKLSTFAAYPSYARITEHLLRQRLGIKAPDFTLPMVSGNRLTLSKVKSKYVLLEFHVSYLVPFQQQEPALRRLYATYHPSGLEIIRVLARDDTNAAGLQTVPWLRVIDTTEPTSTVWSKFGVDLPPYYVLLNARKEVIGRAKSVENIEALLSSLLRMK
ncbi:redoxin domain protein [Fibrisoma limi BUZ 3]|uniref:Redoxin domain protein n=1 Tax=Fibrisoma limi BUZ 3 TaxID=1185876 RepID=I2GJY1_9BACT|nr:TlpA disulfide reductase family protein [Fibrisoma limi]CCH54206.1 redoxin domain protein [Fibrisoma limi BUZ 3]